MLLNLIVRRLIREVAAGIGKPAVFLFLLDKAC